MSNSASRVTLALWVTCRTYSNLHLRRVLEPHVDHEQSVTHFDCGRGARSYMMPTVEQEELQPLQPARWYWSCSSLYAFMQQGVTK